MKDKPITIKDIDKLKKALKKAGAKPIKLKRLRLDKKFFYIVV